MEGLQCEDNVSDFKDELDSYEDEEDLVEVDDLSETVCCICDNGGEVICCDGPCMRSFHVNKDASGARDSDCSTLNLNKAEAEKMDSFFCPNCKYKEHQCYICKKLGCSDESAGAAQEVFLCDSAMCGHFYHPDCVAQMLLKDAAKAKVESLADSIKKGHGFVCPMHKCWLCGKGEDKKSLQFQFGICRRCPRVWHRKCFPKYLRFEKEDDKPQRAWDGLLSDRVLIYCIGHKIVRKLYTPARTQVEFPEIFKLAEKSVDVRKKRRRLIKLASLGMKKTVESKAVKDYAESNSKKRKGVETSRMDIGDTGFSTHGRKINKVGVNSTATSDKSRRISPKQESAVDMAAENNMAGFKAVEGHTKPGLRELPQSIGCNSSKELSKATSVKQIQNLKQAAKIIPGRGKSDKGQYAVYDQFFMKAELGRPQDIAIARYGMENMGGEKLEMSSTAEQRSGTTPPVPLSHHRRMAFPIMPVVLDSTTRSLIQGLVSKTKELVTLESIHRKHDTPLCYQRNLMNLDKKYSRVKIESIMKGTRKAVATLESGGTIEDAQAQCAPSCLKFLEGCKIELRVFLAPFLHGERYTPFGRHFTKPDKLQEIVDRLHWYVQSGDMIVDFCCGSNEFSLLMKAKLDEVGKNCEYRNFDIIQAKHSFNFVKKDWFKVEESELAEGGRLIMGLNPPFGVKARLANSFIDHALKFRPKILILIVPIETQRLDRKHIQYDLIWEDFDLLKGHSFFLPGSVGKDEKPLNDWNKVPPVLSVWSRPDWTFRHKQIAAETGQVPDYHEFEPRHNFPLQSEFPHLAMQERLYFLNRNNQALPRNEFHAGSFGKHGCFTPQTRSVS